MKNYVSFNSVTGDIYTITNTSNLVDFKDFENIKEILMDVDTIPDHRDFIIETTSVDGEAVHSMIPKPIERVKKDQDAQLKERAKNVTDFELLPPRVKYHIEYLYEQINELRKATNLPAMSMDEHKEEIKKVVRTDHARVFKKE